MAPNCNIVHALCLKKVCHFMFINNFDMWTDFKNSFTNLIVRKSSMPTVVSVGTTTTCRLVEFKMPALPCNFVPHALSLSRRVCLLQSVALFIILHRYASGSTSVKLVNWLELPAFSTYLTHVLSPNSQQHNWSVTKIRAKKRFACLCPDHGDS